MSAPWLVNTLMRTYRQGDWVEQALCAQMGDKEAWFPDKGQSNREAKTICAMCDVKTECLDYAVNSPAHVTGIWGGLSETERDQLRKERNIPNVQDRIEHGTPAGARAHYRLREKPCPDCANAQTQYNRTRTNKG